MKKKSLLIYIPSVEGGGVEKFLYLITNYFIKKKLKVIIITAFNCKKKYINKKAKIVSLKHNHNLIKSRFIRNLISVFLFFKHYWKDNITIFSLQSNITAIILSLISNKRIIIRSNTSPDKYIKNSLKKFIFRFFFNFADKIIVNSYEFKKRFKNFFSISPIVIYNPFIKKNVKKVYFNFFNDKKFLRIINIGRLTDQKDHLTLLRAVKKLDKYRKFRLTIIGRGYREKLLRKYISENKLQEKVRMIGYRENADSYIRDSDIFVLPSIYEGAPNVLLESIFLKKYVISADCPTGPKEILNNGKYGDLFKIGDHNQLFKLLKNFNKNSPKVKYKVTQGYKSLARFDYRTNCEKYFQIISKYL